MSLLFDLTKVWVVVVATIAMLFAFDPPSDAVEPSGLRVAVCLNLLLTIIATMPW